MQLTFLNILFIVTAAQGFFLTALIIHKYGRFYPNRFLSALMLVYSLILVDMMVQDSGLFAGHSRIMLIVMGFPLLVGPLHYLYALALIRHEEAPKLRDGIHFLLFLLLELFLIPAVLHPDIDIIMVSQHQEEPGIPLLFFAFNWLVNIVGITYMVLTIRLLTRHDYRMREMYSSVEKVKLEWLRLITWVGVGVWCVFLVENIFMLAGIDLTHLYSLSSGLGAFYVYALGYTGLAKSGVLRHTIPEAGSGTVRKAGSTEGQTADSRVVKYERSGLSPDKAREYKEQLLGLMETNRPYRNSELTLQELADLLRISPHNLSEVINTQLRQNFFDFINRYRVREVMENLTSPDLQHLKILSIAFDAGFNSKTSFNTIFKKSTGQTPSEYRAQQLQLNATQNHTTKDT